MKAVVIGIGLVMVGVAAWGQNPLPPCDEMENFDPCGTYYQLQDTSVVQDSIVVIVYEPNDTCCVRDPCADCNAPWVERMENIYVRVGFRGIGSQPDSCIVFVKYRVRHCPPQCCELQVDWIMPECTMCQHLHNVLNEVQKQIARYDLNGVCWSLTNPQDFSLVMRRPFCWGQTSTPPPDIPEPPQGWTGEERWLIPCPNQPTCCFRMDYQIQNGIPCPVGGCFTEQPNQPPCPPECPYRGCCPYPSTP